MGPSGVIYTTQELDAGTLASIVRPVASSAEGESSYWFGDTSVIGGRFTGEERPFVIGLVEFCGDDAERAQIEEFMGAPFRSIEIGAMCNDDIDWVVIVDVISWLASQTHGCVALPQMLTREPMQGHTAVIRPVEGNVYSIVDHAAFVELALKGTRLVEK